MTREIYRDPFYVEANYVNLHQLLRRIAKEEGVLEEQIRTRKKTKNPKINNAKRRFCYEAYKTGRYGYGQISGYLRMGKKGRWAIMQRINQYCEENNLERPRFISGKPNNLAGRKMVKVSPYFKGNRGSGV